MHNVNNFQTKALVPSHMSTSVADTVIADVHWTIERTNERVWISLQCHEVTSVSVAMNRAPEITHKSVSLFYS